MGDPPQSICVGETLGTLGGGWAPKGIVGGVCAPLGWGPVGYFCESAIIGYLEFIKDFVLF